MERWRCEMKPRDSDIENSSWSLRGGDSSGVRHPGLRREAFFFL